MTTEQAMADLLRETTGQSVVISPNGPKTLASPAIRYGYTYEGQLEAPTTKSVTANRRITAITHQLDFSFEGWGKVYFGPNFFKVPGYIILAYMYDANGHKGYIPFSLNGTEVDWSYDSSNPTYQAITFAVNLNTNKCVVLLVNFKKSGAYLYAVDKLECPEGAELIYDHEQGMYDNPVYVVSQTIIAANTAWGSNRQLGNLITGATQEVLADTYSKYGIGQNNTSNANVYFPSPVEMLSVLTNTNSVYVNFSSASLKPLIVPGSFDFGDQIA